MKCGGGSKEGFFAHLANQSPNHSVKMKFPWKKQIFKVQIIEVVHAFEQKETDPLEKNNQM